MLRRVAGKALNLMRSDEDGMSQSAQRTQLTLVSLSEVKALPTLTGISASVASLAHGTVPDFQGERIALTSGATHDSAVNNVLNTADDGETFWGPIDNESARSKATGETLIIDQWECIECGTCVENTDAVFALPYESKASVFNQEGPMDLIQDAIDACPVTCITWTPDPDSFEQLNDHKGQSLS